MVSEQAEEYISQDAEEQEADRIAGEIFQEEANAEEVGEIEMMEEGVWSGVYNEMEG